MLLRVGVGAAPNLERLLSIDLLSIDQRVLAHVRGSSA